MSDADQAPPDAGKGQNNLSELERRLLDKIRRRERVSRNVNELHSEQLGFGERIADGLADVA